MRTRVDLVGVISAVAAVAFVTAAVAVLKPYVPVLSLGVLYELAVLPVAVLWGVPLAWRRLLHNQKALYVKRLLLFEPHVILASVPYQLLR